MKTRTCWKCKREKPINQFYRHWKTDEPGEPHWEHICKKCQKTRRRAYYASRKSDYRQRMRMCESRKRKENRLKIFEHLLAHPCIDCGESDIIILEFDHRDGTQKVDNVSSMPKHYGWEKILAEIQKCDVRCVKCHGHRHATKDKRVNSHEKYLELKKELYGDTGV